MTITVCGISGSLRKGSLNSKLLAAAAARMPEGSELAIASIDDVPLYNHDLEQAGMPDAVEKLKARIADADALLIATPEYNNSMPGVLKNTIDWCTRPPKDSANVFRNKPVAIMGATPGGFGTQLSQAAWLPVLRTLGMSHWSGGKILASKAPSLFDDNGALTDEAMDQKLREFLSGFVDFVRVQRSQSA